MKYCKNIFFNIFEKKDMTKIAKKYCTSFIVLLPLYTLYNNNVILQS